MTEYRNTIYPEDLKNQYPQKLSNYIYNRFFKTDKPGKIKILDVGCSNGNALRCFKTNNDNLELYGVDIRDEEAEDVVFKSCNLEIEKMPFEDNSFDFVYSKSVVEHINNTDNFINEVHRVLKPDGVFVCMTPDWKSQKDIFWDDYTHVKPFTRKGLRDALRINGFKQADCEYFYQLPFVWKYPFLKFIPKLIDFFTPECLKWKDKEQRNTKDRKLIRFSKEQMLLSYGRK